MVNPAGQGGWDPRLQLLRQSICDLPVVFSEHIETVRRTPTATTGSGRTPALHTNASATLDTAAALRAWVGIARAA